MFQSGYSLSYSNKSLPTWPWHVLQVERRKICHVHLQSMLFYVWSCPLNRILYFTLICLLVHVKCMIILYYLKPFLFLLVLNFLSRLTTFDYLSLILLISTWNGFGLKAKKLTNFPSISYDGKKKDNESW